jgi:hypothetical protein
LRKIASAELSILKTSILHHGGQPNILARDRPRYFFEIGFTLVLVAPGTHIRLWALHQPRLDALECRVVLNRNELDAKLREQFAEIAQGRIAAARGAEDLGGIERNECEVLIDPDRDQLDAECAEKAIDIAQRNAAYALPSLAVDELRGWRLAQAEELLRLGIRADDNWHVVTQADGSPLRPRSLTHAVSEFLKEWRITLHGLRHTHAGHLLALKEHPKVVRLGYSSIAITMDIYSHLMPNMQEDAAAAVDGVLRAAIKKRSDDIG